MSDEPQTKDPHKIVLNTGPDETANGTAPQAAPPPPPPPPSDPAPAPGQWVELATLEELIADLSKKQAVMVGLATAAAALALMIALRAQGTARAALRAAEEAGGPA